MSDPMSYLGPCPVCKGLGEIDPQFPVNGPKVPCWLCCEEDPFYDDDRLQQEYEEGM